MSSRSLVVLRSNLPRAFAKGLGVLRPLNLLVTGRNAVAVARKPWAGYAGRSQERQSVEQAAEEALAWLARAQDRTGSGGVGSYEFYGWSRGYPEVTGYIIPVFWDYHHLLGRDELAQRAIRMADWELVIQKPDGGWEGGYEGAGQPPIVFNTGQVLRGLIRTHEETGEQHYLDAAVRAADWIVANQEADGSWTKANYLQLKRVYDAYVSAPLARLAVLTGREAYAEAARRNCDFVLRHRLENGWFELCDNGRHFNDAPNTHTLCYTIDGLLETGEVLGEERFSEAAVSSAEALAGCVEPSGRLFGRFDRNWSPRASWVCLPGSAQLGIVLMKLYERSREPRHSAVARQLLDFLLFAQQLNSVGEERRGALAGAFPVWGLHGPFTYPCWAAKYFLDLVSMLGRASEPQSEPASVH